MAAVSRARLLAKELGISGKNVFFNEAWVPYEERQNYLLESDLGVSTHFQHVETTFSFRTRILDYLWCGLPIVSTAGDSFGDLVAQEGLGAAVPERDQTALVEALERLLYNRKEAEIAKANVMRVREEFTWEKVLAPLVEFCRNPVFAADKILTNGSFPKTATKVAIASGGKKSSNYSGIRRDLERVSYYLRNGGPSAVLERLKARRERKREAKSPG
jgi:hypothetical protein